MDKRGLSTIVITLIIIVLVLGVIGVIWAVIKNIIEKEVEIAEVTSKFFSERVKILDVKIDNSIVSFGIKKLTGELVLVGEEITTPPLEVDIISVVDLSGSMRACYGVSSSCCSRNLGGSWTFNNCYGIRKDKENVCIQQCGGTWIDKLTPTQDANKNITGNILSSDKNRIGLVGYNNSVASSASIDLTNNIAQLNARIDSWEAGGTTCICCGINEAATKLKQQSSVEKMKAIIVMSDGEANVRCSQQGTGDAKQDAIQAACDANSTLETLTIYSIGAGTDADEITLTSIAECGDGKYFSVEDTNKLVEIYQTVTQEIENKYRQAHQINYLLIVFYNETSLYKESVTDIPGALETKKYSFNLEGKLSGELQKIEIYPVIITSSKKEIIGPVLDSWEK